MANYARGTGHDDQGSHHHDEQEVVTSKFVDVSVQLDRINEMDIINGELKVIHFEALDIFKDVWQLLIYSRYDDRFSAIKVANLAHRRQTQTQI